MTKINAFKALFALTVCALAAACSSADFRTDRGASTAAATRPNILLIVADDLGYTDLGVFGGEIPTPNLDALAQDGVLLTQFYASPNCSPTRAMLLSGADHHIAGLGHMDEAMADNQRGQPGYEGYLNTRVVSLSELLSDAGYHTYMTGKWHLGFDEATSPAARGFDRSYAMVEGGAGHFGDMLPYTEREGGKAIYREDGALVEALPEDFYSSRFFARRLIDYIETGRADGRPFFGYLAFTAVHWPLQAPRESIARHAGRYDAGYDALHEQRLEALRARGLIPKDMEVFPGLPQTPAWTELSADEQRIQARIMEVYAAMVADIDLYVGEVVAYLKSIGEFDNTLILFMSDNGAEGHDFTSTYFGAWANDCCDNSYDNIGAADSYVWPGAGWTRASVGPWRMFKGFPSEGGVRVPAFVRHAGLQSGVVHDTLVTVKDVMPTVLELAGIDHPAPTYQGRTVAAMQGSSMLPVLEGDAATVHAPDYVMGWELFDKKAIRQGDWKIVQEPRENIFSPRADTSAEPLSWALYNLAEDPGEQTDLSAELPDKLDEMIALWEAYVEENGVILPSSTSGY